jgi:hypothetical protein
MSLRRSETDQLKATEPTATATNPGQAALVGQRWSR